MWGNAVLWIKVTQDPVSIWAFYVDPRYKDTTFVRTFRCFSTRLQYPLRTHWECCSLALNHRSQLNHVDKGNFCGIQVRRHRESQPSTQEHSALETAHNRAKMHTTAQKTQPGAVHTTEHTQTEGVYISQTGLSVFIHDWSDDMKTIMGIVVHSKLCFKSHMGCRPVILHFTGVFTYTATEWNCLTMTISATMALIKINEYDIDIWSIGTHRRIRPGAKSRSNWFNSILWAIRKAYFTMTLWLFLINKNEYLVLYTITV